MSKIKPVKFKIPDFKWTDGEHDFFEVDFHINNSLLTESVKSVAISADNKKIYIRMCDMRYDDIFVSDLIKYKKDDIDTITISVCDRRGNILDKQEFKGKIIDIASFDFNYDREICDVLAVFDYDDTKV